MEHGVFRAFHHINTHMHPQAIIVDGSNKEEGFFIRAARQQSKLAGNTLIELPRETLKSLLWMTKLDSAALKGRRPSLFDMADQQLTVAPQSMEQESD